ncbi:MAG: NAD(P)H-quinone oxidoreductase [Propionibacteriaceae bacterium]|nr:NAD(P)H-quinone oxidoreductase [Propionibacteriaceae bacterium]
MRIIFCTSPGGPENLVVAQAPTPNPGPGEVRLRVHAAGVNRADLLQRQGFYPPPPGISEVIGLEVSGIVDAVGAGVDPELLGSERVALLAGGGYAEYVVVPAGQTLPIPAGIDLVSAAGVIEVAATVLSNFDHVSLHAGETVLIHGGAGGIGTFAIGYAKQLKTKVIVTAGTPEKRELCLALGADAALDYHGDPPGWIEGVMTETAGAGVDVILDIMGAKYLEANVDALAAGGRLVVIGLQGGTKGTLNLNRLLSKRGTITATSLRFRPVAQKVAICAEVEKRVWPLYESGKLKLPPQRVFNFENVAAAHSQLASGENVGKIILQVSN